MSEPSKTPRPDILQRCDWCNWPLEESRASGCHESDCSFRPLPTTPPDFELRRYARSLETELAASQERVERLAALLREWLTTELDSMDEEFLPWIDSFTARIEAALGERHEQ